MNGHESAFVMSRNVALAKCISPNVANLSHGVVQNELVNLSSSRKFCRIADLLLQAEEHFMGYKED